MPSLFCYGGMFFLFYFFRQGERPKALLVIEDLTFNGEYQSFIDLAHFFKQIESLGTKVLVEPGNHDIADEWLGNLLASKIIKQGN